jgi:hypothetical protein
MQVSGPDVYVLVRSRDNLRVMVQLHPTIDGRSLIRQGDSVEDRVSPYMGLQGLAPSSPDQSSLQWPAARGVRRSYSESQEGDRRSCTGVQDESSSSVLNHLLLSKAHGVL